MVAWTDETSAARRGGLRKRVSHRFTGLVASSLLVLQQGRSMSRPLGVCIGPVQTPAGLRKAQKKKRGKKKKKLSLASHTVSPP